MSLTRIGSIGINTGIAFAGVTTIVTLNTANDALSIGATVNVGSGITLGASGDIFATGVSTVTTLKVGSGVTISSDGDVFFTGIATGNGSGLTALNASNISSGTVPTARLGSGTASSSTFLRGDSTFQTVNTDLVSDTSPQLGGNLDVNTKNIVFGDSSGATDDRLTFGAGTDLSIYHDGNHSRIVDSGTGVLSLQSNDLRIHNVAADEFMAKFVADGAVELYYDNSKKFETANHGVTFFGTSFHGDNIVSAFGASSDLQIYHNGSNSYVANSTGQLVFEGDDLMFMNSGRTEALARFQNNGAVDLYYDNGKVFETSASEIKVERRIKINADGPGSGHGMSIGQWDGSNHRIEGDADRPMLITAYNSGGVKMGVSGSTSATVTGDGITFGGDTAAANALDDYEEGTWTASVTGGAITTNAAYYTKIGRLVTWYLYAKITNTANDANQFRIYGLPYTVLDGSYYGNAGVFTYTQSANNAGLESMGVLAHNASTYIYFHFVGRGDATPPTNSYFHSNMLGANFIISGSYYS